MTIQPTGRVGLYVHVPFCVAHCPYCDFAVTVTRTIPHAAYLEAVLTELRARRSALAGRRLSTIYFGGGTPGLWNAESIVAVIDAAREAADIAAIEEITVELNPERVDAGWLRTVVAGGVDRVSLGAQSLDLATLRLLGRSHAPDDVVRAVDLARAAGVREVSVDLIYGTPGATVETTRADSRAFASLVGVDHISAYELTWEGRTSFDRRRRTGELVEPGDDALIEMAEVVTNTLGEAGFVRYEVSNFARPGHEARHNSAYWAGHEYLGLGVGAHSLELVATDGVARRRANPRALRRYLEASNEPAEIEQLDAATHLAECVMVAVRTLRGVDAAELRVRFGDAAAALAALLGDWKARGLGQLDGEVFVANRDGLRVADSLGLEALERLVPVGA